MHRGFNLKLDQNFQFLSASYDLGLGIRAGYEKKIATTLDSFALAGGALNATKMQNEWFPQARADVFISHSHADETIAIGLAGWLKRAFGLTAFVDSCVWGHADRLLQQIDDQLCYQEKSDTYSYTKRNKSTSHVHMMLSTALSNMMDGCECILFLNTPASVVPADVIEGRGGDTTLSPWLYFEIAMTRLLRKSDKSRRSPLQKTAADNLGEALNMQYTLALDHLAKLDLESLKQWYKASQDPSNEDVHPLDLLYWLTG